MKKNYLFLFTMALFAILNFIACGSDDDENGGDEGGAIDIAGKTELYMNGKKVEVIQEKDKALFAYDRYGGGAVGLGTNITYMNENGKEVVLQIHFQDFEEAYHNNNEQIFANVNIGDDFTKISPITHYELHTSGVIYYLHGSESGNADWINDCLGTVKVTKLNKSDKAIRIDFKDIQVVKEDNKGFINETAERITFSGFVEGLVKY